MSHKFFRRRVNLFHLLGIILALTACAPATQLPVSPTLAAPTLLPPTSTPDDTIYVSNTYGFRLQIPDGFRVIELPVREGIPLAIGFVPQNDDPSQNFEIPFGLTVYEKHQEDVLLDWFSSRTGYLTESSQPASPNDLFFHARLLNNNDFKGNTALQYTSNDGRAPDQTLIDRGAWVIGLYALQAYSPNFDAGPVYEQMLTSLEFFEPTVGPVISATQPLPTSAPDVCLDESAQPRVLPPRDAPLEVQFTSDGNIWLWEEGSATANQVSDTGDAQSFSFSPDRSVVAFTRGPLEGQPSEWQTGLWAIDQDGTNLRLLVSADQLHTLAGEPPAPDTPYADHVVNLTWIEGTQTLGFGIDRENFEDPGESWQVNLDTGEISPWTPPSPEITDEPEGLLSPDGSQVALIHETTLSLMNADGSNVREDIFSFTTFPHMGGVTHPMIQWAHDSQSLLAITFTGDLNTPDTTFTTWRIPVDGTPAQELHTFPAAFWIHLSPDQQYLAYIKVLDPQTNDSELHLATYDGSQDIVYDTQDGLAFLGWHADSYHFVYHQVYIYRPFLGSVCGGSVPLLDISDTPAFQIEWIDATRFLFAKGWFDREPGELRLGQIGEPSTLIGPFTGSTPYFPRYFFNLEKAPLGQQ